MASGQDRVQRRARARQRRPAILATPRIGITMGDPAGIGPEIILKALSSARLSSRFRPILFGHPSFFERCIRQLQLPLQLREIGAADTGTTNPHVVPIVPIGEQQTMSAVTTASAAGGQLAAQAIELATKWVLDGELDAITTAPIHKVGLARAGYPFEGHTEFLASLSGAKTFGMMMIGGGLRIMLATIHLAIRELPSRLTRERVVTAIRLTDHALTEWFGIPHGRIGVAGLNPHASDEGRFGDEEARLITPAIEQARRSDINASGPYPADTLFYRARSGAFDATVAIYHDQALIPIKVLAFGRAVNLTVGLPFVRTSVDHGTAYDIAGQGIADPGSMQEALSLAISLTRRSSTHRRRARPQPPQ